MEEQRQSPQPLELLESSIVWPGKHTVLTNVRFFPLHAENGKKHFSLAVVPRMLY